MFYHGLDEGDSGSIEVCQKDYLNFLSLTHTYTSISFISSSMTSKAAALLTFMEDQPIVRLLSAATVWLKTDYQR